MAGAGNTGDPHHTRPRQRDACRPRRRWPEWPRSGTESRPPAPRRLPARSRLCTSAFGPVARRLTRPRRSGGAAPAKTCASPRPRKRGRAFALNQSGRIEPKTVQPTPLTRPRGVEGLHAYAPKRLVGVAAAHCPDNPVASAGFRSDLRLARCIGSARISLLRISASKTFALCGHPWKKAKARFTRAPPCTRWMLLLGNDLLVFCSHRVRLARVARERPSRIRCTTAP
jgi:hypothetical protein